MDTLPVKRNYLQLVPTLLLFLGFILVLAGFVIEFVGRPERGGQSFWFYVIVMRSSAICVLLGVCFLMAQAYSRRNNSPDPPGSHRPLPITATLPLWIGCLLIVAGITMEFTGWPKPANERSLLFNFAMATGAFSELVGASASWQWFRRRRSRAN